MHSLLGQLVALATPEHGGEHAVALLEGHASQWLWPIVALPLLGAVLNAALGLRLQRSVGKKVNHGIAIGAMLGAWVFAIVAFVQLLGAEPEHRMLTQKLWTILSIGRGFTLDLAFALDPLSMLLVLIITTIGTLIHVYATGYMADDKAYWRFFAYLNVFVFAMLCLVMGDNFGVMFFGWEGVGFASWGLIGFWYEDVEKARAGMKAFVVNRIGDFGFLAGLFLLFWTMSGSFGELPGAQPTFNFSALQHQLSNPAFAAELQKLTLGGLPLVGVMCLLLFVGATGKSAQVPLYVWLPDAMAGPTPVSALIHAATMVTAGVYMIARLNFLFALSPLAMTVVACTGAFTALFAASIGFVQTDIKKVLAYSTVSQLGFMFIGVGVGAYWTGVYHLLTHAFFKACLFLGAGAVIVACHHEQDMRKMGGLKKYIPLTEKTYFYSCLSITAAPVFFLGNGFFSKDEILWNAFRAGDNLLVPGWTIWLTGLIAAAGTAFYMWRSYYMTFTGEYRGLVPAHSTEPVAHAHTPAPNAHTSRAHGAHGAHGGHDDHADEDEAHHHHGGPPTDVPKSMSYVLAALAFGSFATIFLGLWAPLGHTPALETWLEPVISAAGIVAARQAHPEHLVEWMLMGASIVMALAGWGTARAFYKDAKSTVPEQLAAAMPRFHRLVLDKYRIDELYGATVIRAVMLVKDGAYWFDRVVIDGLVHLVAWLGLAVANLDGAIDKYFVDGLVNMLADLTLFTGKKLRHLQTGRIQTYLYGALVGAIAFVGISYLFR